MVGYNVQTAVDTETHLIVAHEVTNQGFDRDQLSPMAAAAKEALGLQSAIGQFPEAVGQAELEVAEVESWRLAIEQVAPLSLQAGRCCVIERAHEREKIRSS